MSIYKFLGTQISISSANNMGGLPLSRVYATSNGILTVAYANGTTYANASLTAGESIIVEKAATDTLAGSGLVAVPIAYRN